MSQIKRSILDVELNSKFTNRNDTLTFLFLKLSVSSSIFLFELNEFKIKSSKLKISIGVINNTLILSSSKKSGDIVQCTF